MKKIVSALLVSAAISAPAFAAGNSNVEVNYGLDLNGVIGIQGDFDISSNVGAPVSIEAVYKNYSQSYSLPFFGTYKWSYTGIGVAGIYDLSSTFKLDKKFRPYVGLGLMHLNATFSGPAGGGAFVTAANTGGVYITGGVKYMVTPQVAADLNYNNFGGLTIGAAYYF
ncbi:MAG TPA: opacity family porin [Gallionellaceae bacterium]